MADGHSLDPAVYGDSLMAAGRRGRGPAFPDESLPPPDLLLSVTGHRFADVRVLAEALTHPSALVLGRSQQGRHGYERLEFLGDRVLGLTVAQMLYEHFPQEKEGPLARRLAALVKRDTLAEIARQLGLNALLQMSRAEEQAGGRDNPTTLGDCCEALLGALYLDAGFAVVDALVRRLWAPLMEQSASPPKDAKTALQEWAQARGLPLPVYQVVTASGPSHHPNFEISVTVNSAGSVTASASSKRAAEQAAATLLLGKITSV